MKSGTGDDPFADPFEEEAEDETAAAESAAAAEAEPSPAAAEVTDTDADVDEAVDTQADSETTRDTGSEADPDAAEHSATESSATAEASDAATADDSHIPWVLRRSSVKDDRPNITQFFLRDETDRAERGLRSDVEQILDKDVYTLDLREAAYLVAMEHPEEVAETLREWGYDYLD